MLFKCWASVVNDGATLKRHCVYAPSLLAPGKTSKECPDCTDHCISCACWPSWAVCTDRKNVSSPAHSEHATPSKLCTYINYFCSVRQRRGNILDTTAKFVATHIIRPIYRHDTTDRRSVMACLWKYSPFFLTSLQHFAEHEFCLVKFGSTFEHSTWIMSYT